MSNEESRTSDAALADLQARYAAEAAAADPDGAGTRYSLFDLALAPEVPPAALLATLLADPVTARLLVAWRKSVAELEAARAQAEAAGDDVSWFDVNTAANDEDEP
jgi:hypothetical protein